MYINSSFIHFILYISVPGAINNLTVANVTSRSVQICWKEPCFPCELRENEIQLYSIAQNKSVQITVFCVFCFVCNSVVESLEHFN
jgi:hypothetical protein